MNITRARIVGAIVVFGALLLRSANAWAQWGPWTDRGGVLTSGPAVASFATNRLDVFARGQNNALWHLTCDFQRCVGWEDLGGVITSDPACVSWGAGRLDCFARGQNNGVWQKSWQAGTGWSGWVDRGGIVTSSPAVSSWGPGRLDVFARGQDNALWHNTCDGSQCVGWERLGGVITSDPACVSAPGRIDCFARGQNNAVWQLTWLPTGWKPWVDRGGVVTSGPAASSWGPDRLDVFARGQNNHLWHLTCDYTRCLGWEDLGGVITSDPDCVAQKSPRRIDCFARGQNNAVWHLTWPSTGTPPGPTVVPDQSAPPQVLSFVPPSRGAKRCPSTPSAPKSGGIDAMSCYMPRPNTEVWSISRPDVTKSSWVDYPSIRFRRGDLVTIVSGGCANRGGIGPTMARYVAPITLTNGADGTHFGMVRIPGVLDARKLADAIRGGPVAVRSDPGSDGFLRLRYDDNGYGDNGYVHDDGLLEQCREMEDAWFVVVIQHDCADGSGPQCVRARPLDLLGNADESGFPKNPDWGWRALVGTVPPVRQLCNFSTKQGTMPEDNAGLCTGQPTDTDTNRGLCGQVGQLGGIQGHINWKAPAVASYEGALAFGAYSTTGDQDYDLVLFPEARMGTTATRDTFNVEFNSEETFKTARVLNQHRAKTPWWESFVLKADAGRFLKAGNYDEVKAFFGCKRAVVTGMVNLDCAHDAEPELHPAFAIAINVKSDPQDDVWAIFVRNAGDEGYCSTQKYQLPVSAMTLRLPGPGATGVSQTSDSRFFSLGRGAGFPSVAFAPGGAAKVTFPLPPPQAGEFVHGELHLRWSVPAGAAWRAPANCSGAPAGAAAIFAAGGADRPQALERGAAAQSDGREGDSAERHLAALVEKGMTPAQREAFLAANDSDAGSGADKGTFGLPSVELTGDGAAARVAARVAGRKRAKGSPRVEAVADPRGNAEKQRMQDALHRILGDQALPKEGIEQPH